MLRKQALSGGSFFVSRIDRLCEHIADVSDGLDVASLVMPAVEQISFAAQLTVLVVRRPSASLAHYTVCRRSDGISIDASIKEAVPVQAPPQPHGM